MDETIFTHAILNGDLLPFDQARVPLNNKALLSAFGVYENIKIERGRPFYLEDHFRRLLHSAGMLAIDLGVNVPILVGWFEHLAQTSPTATYSLRVVALGALDSAGPIIAMWPEPLPTYPAELYQNGAAAVLYEGQRAIPACKSLNTLVNTLARRAATRAGAVEGLLHHHGYLTEGARSNLFVVRQGQLFTSPITEVLSGITRDVVLHVMQPTAYPVSEAPLPVDISLYDEVFISSTSMHVLPITRIDDRPVGAGRVGPVTQLVMTHFAAHYYHLMGFDAR
jgi:branched-subunit amino acid aminotransferase/4-amino-4-deoxychorismate lyase